MKVKEDKSELNQKEREATGMKEKLIIYLYTQII